MKKIVLIALAFITLQATAQDHRREGHRKGERKERAFKRLGLLSAEEQAEIQTKRMTLHLDLTGAQQSQIQKLVLKQAQERKQKIKDFKAKKEQAEKRQKFSKEERLKRLNNRLDNQIAMQQGLKNILNDEQYEKWQKNTKHRIRKRSKHRTKRRF